MSSLEALLARALQERREAQLFRSRKTLDSAQGVRVVVAGKPCLSFCSNDYLGLANHPEVVTAFMRGAEQYGVGSGASHLVSGHSRAHQQLEEELAGFTGRERALLFSSGYLANLGVISALVGKGNFILEDKLNHASLLDAGLLSGARFQRYLHGDVASLQKHLVNAEGGNTLVVTDGVFSMDGDLAPLPALVPFAQQHDAWVMVDDAHGLGVLGKHGAGTLEHFSMTAQDVPILMGTLGKAFGTAGAFVAGSHDLIEYLIQFARSYIYTTALPAAVAEATRCSVQLVAQGGALREQLYNNIREFRRCAVQCGMRVMDSQTAIQPVLIGDNAEVVRLGVVLQEQGFLIGVIRPPTVPGGTARLRITLSAAHTTDEIHRLVDALQVALQGGGRG